MASKSFPSEITAWSQTSSRQPTSDPDRVLARYRLGSVTFTSEGMDNQISDSNRTNLGQSHLSTLDENDINSRSMPVEHDNPHIHGKARRSLVSGVSFYIDDVTRCGPMRVRAAHLLDSSLFEIAVGVVVFVNALTIGIELSLRMEGVEGEGTKLLSVLDKCFLGVYVAELSLRLFSMHLACLKDHWVKFDATIVLCGAASEAMPETYEGLGVLTVLRMARLFRLVRAIRLLAAFRDLFVLVRGLLDSAGTVFYTLLLLIGILYVFACVGVELIGAHTIAGSAMYSADFQDVAYHNFRSVPIAMLTLVQFVCLDSIAAIYSPLISEDPILAVYFMFTILVIGIVLMNLITAVVVNSALEQATHDKESQRIKDTDKKKRLVRNLRKMFMRLDENMDSRITPMEIVNMAGDDRAMMVRVLGLTDPIEIFAALDIEGKGSLDIDEFCDGIWQVAISEAPIELKRLEKMVASVMHKLTETHTLSPWAAARHQAAVTELKIAHAEIADSKTTTAALADHANPWEHPPKWAREHMLELRRLAETTERAVSDAAAKSLQSSSPDMPRQHMLSLTAALDLLPDKAHRSLPVAGPLWIRVTDSAKVYTQDPFDKKAPTPVPSGPFKPPTPPRTESPRSAPGLEVSSSLRDEASRPRASKQDSMTSARTRG